MGERKEKIIDKKPDNIEQKDKVLSAFLSPTIRGIVNEVNLKKIPHNDIVTIIKDTDKFILLYYE